MLVRLGNVTRTVPTPSIFGKGAFCRGERRDKTLITNTARPCLRFLRVVVVVAAAVAKLGPLVVYYLSCCCYYSSSTEYCPSISPQSRLLAAVRRYGHLVGTTTTLAGPLPPLLRVTRHDRPQDKASAIRTAYRGSSCQPAQSHLARRPPTNPTSPSWRTRRKASLIIPTEFLLTAQAL